MTQLQASEGMYDITYLDVMPDGMMIAFELKNGTKPLLIIGTMKQEG